MKKIVKKKNKIEKIRKKQEIKNKNANKLWISK